jgi:hypothetical protein
MDGRSMFQEKDNDLAMSLGWTTVPGPSGSFSFASPTAHIFRWNRNQTAAQTFNPDAGTYMGPFRVYNNGYTGPQKALLAEGAREKYQPDPTAAWMIPPGKKPPAADAVFPEFLILFSFAAALGWDIEYRTVGGSAIFRLPMKIADYNQGWRTSHANLRENGVLVIDGPQLNYGDGYESLLDLLVKEGPDPRTPLRPMQITPAQTESLKSNGWSVSRLGNYAYRGWPGMEKAFILPSREDHTLWVMTDSRLRPGELTSADPLDFTDQGKAPGYR